MNSEKVEILARGVFSKHVPEYAQSYCYELWKEHNFTFKVSRKRNSKLGDYRFDPSKSSHQISVNHDLNRYSFLITYIHELAHLTTQVKFGNRVKPHGKEWKREFRTLMFPMLTDRVFPDEILRPLADHMKNPKASSTVDGKLLVALRNYDSNSIGTLLSHIEVNSQFLFNKTVYKKLEKRRTRSICLNMNSGRKYLISESAQVQAFKNS